MRTDPPTADVDALAPLLRRVPHPPRVVVSGNYATPWTVLKALDAELPEYRLFALNAQPGIPDREGVVPETAFVGPGMRRHPRLSYVPSRLSLVPRLFATTLPPDVVVIHTSLPRDGAVSLGTEVNILPAAVEAARSRGGLVIAQMNRNMPWTFGDAVLPVSVLDAAVEVDEPLAVHLSSPPDDTALQIGARVAARVVDGATLQTGIGAVPDATLTGLTGRRGLRIWTEMFSDGVLALEAAGALDVDVPLTTSFVFGSQDLYDWLDGNARVRVMRTEHTNAPSRIAANHAMTSVNTALQVDLFGQANASRIGARIFSGFGGQTDFIVGAMQSEGGQALMALRSWHPKADCSTIVPLVDEPVTSFQHTAVVTENGTAEIWGHDEREQARQLIDNAAHPSVREELWEEAVALGLAQ
ncbi:MAG TPA: acetyl-CoA hydrolase/transferase C-terminal domain-containing protein [Actinomycetales bacterium]|nr:acetyl-CoA hydrolase/transferase C-terminal domain-containing protein [Actinomycetales bacterium]